MEKDQTSLFDYIGANGSSSEGSEADGGAAFAVRALPASAEGDLLHRLKQLEDRCLKCRDCALRQGAAQVVFGEGDPRATILLVGEAPGAEEDRLGRPFVGAAGKLLDRILVAAGFQREEVFIGNIVKCRPPGNRIPHPKEVEQCLPHLKQQISLIDPAIVVCLGALASKTLIDEKIKITRERGQWREIDGRFYMPTFHPAALLRDPRRKRDVWEDFQKIEKRYKELYSAEKGDSG